MCLCFTDADDTAGKVCRITHQEREAVTKPGRYITVYPSDANTINALS